VHAAGHAEVSLFPVNQTWFRNHTTPAFPACLPDVTVLSSAYDTLAAMPTVRSVFISDVHLGTRACQADSLIAFLREHPAQHLFLIGDILDFWSMSRGIHWSPAQNTVIQKVLKRARHGEQVIFAGNRGRECTTAISR
jgi:hypothetical protein